MTRKRGNRKEKDGVPHGAGFAMFESVGLDVAPKIGDNIRLFV